MKEERNHQIIIGGEEFELMKIRGRRRGTFSTLVLFNRFFPMWLWLVITLDQVQRPKTIKDTSVERSKSLRFILKVLEIGRSQIPNPKRNPVELTRIPHDWRSKDLQEPKRIFIPKIVRSGRVFFWGGGRWTGQYAWHHLPPHSFAPPLHLSLLLLFDVCDWKENRADYGAFVWRWRANATRMTRFRRGHRKLLKRGIELLLGSDLLFFDADERGPFDMYTHDSSLEALWFIGGESWMAEGSDGLGSLLSAVRWAAGPWAFVWREPTEW